MEHQFYVRSRINGTPMPIDEKALKTLLYYGEIEFEKSSHVHKDSYMMHTFKFKEIKQ